MWNPTEKPWRVTWLMDAPPPLYWHVISHTYATEEQARQAMDEPMVRSMARRVRRVTLERAINPETWLFNGRWQRVDVRRRQSNKLDEA